MSNSNNNGSSSHSSSLYSIEKLSGDNFSSWKFKLQMILMDRGLWEIVDGTEVAPSSVGSGSDTKPQTYLDWKKRDNQALAQIALTVSNSELVHIRNAKSSCEAWLKVCSVYEAKGLAAKVYLRRRFFNVKLQDGTTMQTHINHVRDLADQLFNIGAGVSDEDIAMTLLCSLPETYDYLIVALESRSSEELTSDFVSARLIAEEKRKEESINSNVGGVNANYANYPNSQGKPNNGNAFNHGNGDVAMFAKGNKMYGKSSKPMIKCNHCSKKGHTEDKCYMKHGYPVGHPRHGNSVNTANIASVSVNNAVLHAFVATNNNTKVCDWLIDSGASMHLCNNRNYFDNASYKPIQHRNVILGNNECIQAIGVGDVPVKISINSNKHPNNNNTSNIIDVVFKDVLYVPDIAANLLSVAKMTSNGVQVMFNGNQCNILNKAGECIGSAYKHSGSNLYQISVTPIHALVALNGLNGLNGLNVLNVVANVPNNNSVVGHGNRQH